MLKIPVTKIREYMGTDYTSYDDELRTNCYSYALGLNISEGDICEYAYQPGIMASKVLNIPFEELIKMPVEKRMLLDLKVLRIGSKIIEKAESPQFKTFGNYYCKYWDILLFLSDEKDFHFVRVGNNGELWHKYGYDSYSRKTSMEKIEKKGYSLSKIYRLSLWNRSLNKPY